jgi:predicted ABC-type ATPase
VLVYIGTENVAVNLARIRARVLTGGHDVPEPDVRRRYLRSLANLPIAAQRADYTILFDNSTSEGYRPVGILSHSGDQWIERRPGWCGVIV